MRVRLLLKSDPAVQRTRDLRAIEHIALDSPGAAPWSCAAYAAMMEEGEGTSIWLAEQAGVPIGFACARTVGDEAELLNLAVSRSFRRQGAGQLLLEHVLAGVAGRGARRIFLEVRASNAAALRLYERFGFRTSGQRRRYYPASGAGPSEDAMVLVRELPLPATPGPAGT